MATLKDAITNKVSKIQSDVQKTVNVLKDKVAASAEATKKGSTETPKVTEAPKVTSTPKATETTTVSNPTITISKTPQTYGPTAQPISSNVKNLFGETKKQSPISMVESSLFNKGTENKTIVPTSVVNSADAQGGAVKETVDKTVFQQFSDWFNKPREDITKQTANLFVSHADEEGIHLSKWLENLSMNSVNFINEAEFAILKTVDVAANELGLYEPEEGLTKRFGNQFNYWENYGEERGEESLKKYESDTKAQDLKDRVSWEIYKFTEDKEFADTIGNVVGRVYSTASDPEEISATVGYMLPGILATLAGGGGFRLGTSVFAPSYATEAYQDLSKDKDITDNWGDTGVRSASAGIGILQAMVEEFGDAVGNAPWAKGFSKELRSLFTKNVKKDIVKGGEKIFMDEVEEIADKTIVKELKGGFKEILKDWFRGSVGEGVEEVVQDTILTEGAKSLGSERGHMDLETALTDYFLGQIMGLEIMAPGVAVNFKKNQDLKEEYNKFSDNLDKVAPGINEETKQKFFSAMVTSQQNDANLSEKQISKYEAQTNTLYNQISDLENQLETTTDENTKTTIKEQIDGLNEQIKDIDKKINQWKNTEEEINKYIEEYNAKVEEEEAQKELEQLHADVNQSIEGEDLQEHEMENLSEQTMRDTGIEYQTESPEFKNWFKDSKVVDKEGNPLVVYHGTRYNIKVPDMKKGKLQAYGGGMYFTTDKKGAEFYSKENKNLSSIFRKPRVMEVYLSIQNPIKEGEYKWDNKWIEELKNLGYEVDEKYLSNKKKDVYSKYTFLWMLQNKEKRADFTEDFSRVTGYDGLMVTQPGGEDYWIAFRPEQIKSATNNRGTFDSSNPDIRYSTHKVQQASPINRFNKKDLRKSFENSVKQIISGEKEYGDTEFAQYAYYNTATMVKDTREVMKMRAKVEDLLSKIGVRIRYTTNPKRDLGNSIGLYEPGIKRVTYIADSKEVAIYGHEVLHAIMDVVFDGKITDEALQAKLQKTLRKAINDVKKQFGIDIYKQGTKEYDWANVFAEEWLANSFGEYLAKRELEGPKSFVQKIVEFFKDLIDLLFGTKYNASLNKNLREAFESIANGEVVKERKTFYSKALIGLRLGGKSGTNINPIESSTEITQDAMKESNPEEYAEMNKEDKLQSKQQEELGEHGKEIVEAGKQSDYENEIYNESMDVELSQDVIDGNVSTTPQTIRDAFGKDKKKRKGALSIMKTEAVQAYHDVMTSAKTRVLNISPRIGGRLIQMEVQRDIYIHRYRERAKPFVEAISKLDKKAKLEIKKALLDYGALASEQLENIEQYKQEEVAKLKEVLNKYGISEEATNDMFAMLAELGQRYKDAGLSIKLSDIYFPRTVTDYEGLSDYISNVTGIPQEEKNTLLKRIEEITRDTKLTEAEKEKKIRHLMTTDYHEPGKKSKNAKERKMGLLSEWGEGIYQFYGDPIEALDSYIVTMEDAIQKQLFLGGLQEDAGLRESNVSLEEIIDGLVSQGKISNENLEELKKSISAVLNKKPTPKIVSGAKSIIHIGLLANFISAVTQFDDLGIVILRDKSGLKNVVKALFGKAGIKYSDMGLENSYEIFKEQSNITNRFFAKSFFNAIDRLGKTSFVNTAWESLISQSKGTKSRDNLIKRLTDMYGEETANHIMEKIDSGNYMTDGQIDIDVLTDLLYLLSETQPIYTSDMPTTYLNNGWVRLCYSLQTFTIKRINYLAQGAKDVYKNNGGGTIGAVRAGAWLMYTTAFLAMWGALVGDAQDFLKGDKDETALYKLITEGIDAMLDQLWKDSKGSWLKIWNLSDYDKKAYQRQGFWGWLMGKLEPPIIGMGEDLIEAVTEHNEDEITDLAKYAPIVGKLLYYWFWDELQSDMKGDKEPWELSGEKESWEVSSEKEPREASGEKEPWE